MKRLLTLFLFLIAAPACFAQANGQIFQQNSSCTGNFVRQSLPANSGTTTVTASGTFSATLTVVESNNGGVTWTSAGTISSAGTTSYSTNGFTDLCVYASSYSSGNAQVSIFAGTQGGGTGGGGSPTGAAGGAFYMQAAPCGSLTPCIQLTPDDSTDNCGAALTSFMNTLNAWTGPGLPQLYIYGSPNTGTAFKFTSCDLKFLTSMNIHMDGNATIDCGQTGTDCWQFGPTGLSQYVPASTSTQTSMHGSGYSVWITLDGSGTFIGGAGLTGEGGIYIPPWQAYISINGTIRFWNFGPGNATLGQCAGFAISAEVLNNGLIHGLQWFSWDSTVGRCGISNRDSVGGQGTIVISDSVLSGYGNTACSSVGIVNGGSHTVIKGNSVAGFGVPIRIGNDNAFAGGTVVTGNLLDTNACSAFGVQADIWLGLPSETNVVQNHEIVGNDVHGADIGAMVGPCQEVSCTAAFNNIGISDNVSDNGTPLVVRPAITCASASCFATANVNMTPPSAVTGWCVTDTTYHCN